MSDKPVIAISSCLLGNRVRYDGELKHFPELCKHLQAHFQLLPVCPEVEIGLAVPRPPLHLVDDGERLRMVGRDDPSIDVSDAMYRFCADRALQLHGICGYVFKSRSPSCGLRDIPVSQRGEIVDANHAGLFAEAIRRHYPRLPVADETELLSPEQRQAFIQQVTDYCRHRGISAG